VRDVRVERLQLLVRRFETIQRTVERAGQVRQLDGQPHPLQTLRQRVRPQRLRLARQLLQRPQAHARDPVAEQHHERHRAQRQQHECDQERVQRLLERRDVDTDDQPYRRPLAQRLEAHGQRAIAAAMPGQTDRAAPVDALVDALVPVPLV